MTNPKYSQGMTLVEVMIAMAIIGILALVVYPTYTNQMTKTRRSDAKIALAELAQRQENFYVNGNVYTTSFFSLLGLTGSQTGKYGFKIDDDDPKILHSKDKHYLISFPTTTSLPSGTEVVNDNLIKRFTLKAVPESGGKQADDTHCSWFEIDATGKKEATHNDCW